MTPPPPNTHDPYITEEPVTVIFHVPKPSLPQRHFLSYIYEHNVAQILTEQAPSGLQKLHKHRENR